MPRSAVPSTLGIDVGTTNIKVALVAWMPDGAARHLRQASAPTPQTAEALLATTVRLTGECLAAAALGSAAAHGSAAAPGGPPPGAPPTVIAVGVSSMAETGVPVDADAAPLAPVVGWADDRARSVLPGLHALLDAEALFVDTGVRLGPKPPLAKWRWFAEHEPALWRRTRVWLGAADLVVHALTGRFATDHTLAGRTGALPLGAAGFDPELTAIGGLTPDQLPDVLGPREPAGVVRPGAFADVGLPAGIPVYVAGHDHAVGAHAVGVRAPGDVADSLGTSEAVYAVVDPVPPHRRAAVAAQGMSVVRTVDGGRHAVVGGSPAAGRLVAWWCRTLAPGLTPDTLFDQLDRTVDDGVVVLPYLLGRQAPAPDPDARMELRGIAAEHGGPALAEALCRGLSLHARWLVETALSFGATGSRGAVTLLGGPTRNEGWVRRKAETTPWPTARATEPDAVAAGAALVAAERSGMVVRPLVSEPVAVVPDPRAEALYRAFRGYVGH